MTGPLIVTIGDVRRSGFCARGAKTWSTQNGIDFKTLLSAGIPAETLPPEDPFAQRCIETARKRLTNG